MFLLTYLLTYLFTHLLIFLNTAEHLLYTVIYGLKKSHLQILQISELQNWGLLEEAVCQSQLLKEGL